MFSFCCLQFWRLSFFPYVIKLPFDGGLKYGGRIDQEVEKKRTRAHRYKAPCW